MNKTYIIANMDVKIEATSKEGIIARSYDMQGHAQKGVERNCDLAHKTVDELCKSHHNLSGRSFNRANKTWD